MLRKHEGLDTLRMLDELEAKVRRIGAKSRRLSAALDKAKQKLGPSKKKPRAEPVKAIVDPTPEPAPKTLVPRTRQALGRGLAEIRGRRVTE